ncbi:MAG TPA: hypothetical protein VGM39_24790 [Kofleriaceae bacterium]|jgi:hypothetical protein
MPRIELVPVTPEVIDDAEVIERDTTEVLLLAPSPPRSRRVTAAYEAVAPVLPRPIVSVG